MKLPDDPKERTQILVLVGILGLGALYGLYMAANAMVIKPHKDKVKLVEDLRSKLADATDDVKMMPDLEKNNDEHIATITDISDRHVLHPDLGNYLIPAKKFIGKHAADSKTSVIDVKEIGISEFPMPKPPKPVRDESGHAKPVAAPKKEYAFKIYTARVEIANGYHELLRLIKQIEKSNPYVCITSITVTPSEDNDFAHNMSFDIQWPIWNASVKSTEKIMQQLDSPAFRNTIKKPARTSMAASASAENKPSADEKTAKTETALDASAKNKLKELGVKVDEN